MALDNYAQNEFNASPSITELAAMPEYRRDLHLRFYKGAPPDPAELAEAVRSYDLGLFEGVAFNAKGERVYFLQSETGPIKVGFTADLEKRVRRLRFTSPVSLILLLSVPAPRQLETTLHAKFASHRLHGEWFSPHPDILAEIERLRQSPIPLRHKEGKP